MLHFMVDRTAALATGIREAAGRAAQAAHVVDRADKAIRAAAAERSSALAPQLDGMRADTIVGNDPGRYADALVERSRLDRLTAAPQ